MTGEPARPEDLPLAVGPHPVVVLAHGQLQPGQARQLHLRAQPQQFSRLDRLHPPEIQGVAGEQMAGVAGGPPRGEARTTLLRASTYRDPPAHEGSVGSGSLGAPGVAADDQRVETAPSRVYRRAAGMAWSRGSSPSGGSGVYSAMAWS